MRGQDYCYFHAGTHRAIPSVDLWPSRQARILRQSQPRAIASRRRGNTAVFIGLGWIDDPWGSQLPHAIAIQTGFMRVYWGVMKGLLNVRQGRLFLSALHKAAAGQSDITATGDFAVTSNERQ